MDPHRPDTDPEVPDQDAGGRSSDQNESPEPPISGKDRSMGPSESSLARPESVKPVLEKWVEMKEPFRPASDRLDAQAATGGAVGAVVLGAWATLGALWTSWSGINGAIGLLMGIWGLGSERRKLAWFGILLSLLGVVLALANIGDFVQQWFLSAASRMPLA